MTDTTTPLIPTLDDIEKARVTIAGVARVTPMETSQFLAEVLGSPVHLKCENLQRTGAYKVRGAYNRLSTLTAEQRAAGVVAASAGNHAQGVALAARELGIPATIFTPVGVALPKLQATRHYGAEVVLRGHSVEEALSAAKDFANRTGAVFIPPFDHPAVIAGQGTLGSRSSSRCRTPTPSSCRSAVAGSSPGSPSPSRASPSAPVAASASSGAGRERRRLPELDRGR